MPLALLIIAMTGAQAAAAPAPAAPAAAPMRICRASEREVGSRIRHPRQCKTADEWALEDARRDRRPADLRVTEGQSAGTGPPH